MQPLAFGRWRNRASRHLACATPARIVAVVVTHERPAELRRCLAALRIQSPPPARILVVDDASTGPATAAIVAAFPEATHLRHRRNAGGAAAFRTGLLAAIEAGASHAWLMDDDGCPAAPDCLARLAALAAEGAAIAGPLVLDQADPARLAFAFRIRGRSRFRPADLDGQAVIEGAVHAFNGTLVAAELVAAVGPPEPRFQGRGDEVEFVLRARRAGFRVATCTAARFVHPGAAAEFHPVLGGLFHAAVPLTAEKRARQFRNRAWIFTRYGLWAWLAGDVVRYGAHFLLRRRPDPAGFGAWLRATSAGLGGGFMRARFDAPEVERVASNDARESASNDARESASNDARKSASNGARDLASNDARDLASNDALGAASNDARDLASNDALGAASNDARAGATAEARAHG